MLSLLAFAALAAAQSCAPAPTPLVGITVPVTQPSGATTLSQNLIGFSIEGDRWPEWISTNSGASANTFWVNALNNLKGLAGKPPKIRVGANSEDHTTFNSSQALVSATFPAPSATTPFPEATSITIGPAFYTISKFLPSGTHMIWGLNFGAANVANTVAEAKSIISAFQSSAMKSAGVTLDLLEIGNEADLYNNNGLRNSSYSISQWTTQWEQFAANVSSSIGMTKGASPGFMAPSFAGSDHGGGGFSPQQAFSDGLLSSSPGSLITTISQHHYSGSFCSGSEGLLSDLMTKSTIRGNLSQYKPDISSANSKGLPYIFGETNSYSCHGAPGVSNVAGAALWALDYALQAATLNIQEVYFHEGIGFKYNFVQPIALNRSILDASAVSPPTPAHVQPAYYAAIIANEAIGTSGATTIKEISISNSHVAGYAIYQSGTLARAVFINSQAWTTASTGTRPSVQISTLFLAASGAPTTGTLKRLKINHADDQSGVTWGGQTYETSNALVSGSVSTETITPGSGFTLSATEAVLVTFG